MINNRVAAGIFKISLQLFLCFYSPEISVFAAFVIEMIFFPVNASEGKTCAAVNFSILGMAGDNVDDSPLGIGSI